MGDSGDDTGGTPPWEVGAEPVPSAAELEAAGQSALFGADPVPPAVQQSSETTPDPLQDKSKAAPGV